MKDCGDILGVENKDFMGFREEKTALENGEWEKGCLISWNSSLEIFTFGSFF